MAKYTSHQVLQMLQPIAQFAPAIHAAADIYADVEQAGAELDRIKAEKAKLDGDMEEFTRQRIEFEARTNNARASYHKTLEEVEKAKADIQAALPPLQQQLASLLAEIEKIKAQREDELKLTRDQVAFENKRLEDARKRYDAFKNQL